MEIALSWYEKSGIYLWSNDKLVELEYSDDVVGLSGDTVELHFFLDNLNHCVLPYLSVKCCCVTKLTFGQTLLFHGKNWTAASYLIVGYRIKYLRRVEGSSENHKTEASKAWDPPSKADVQRLSVFARWSLCITSRIWFGNFVSDSEVGRKAMGPRIQILGDYIRSDGCSNTRQHS